MYAKVILIGNFQDLSVFIRVKKLTLVRKNIRIMNNFRTITVLDYESGKVSQYDIKRWEIDIESIEDFLFNNGHSVSNCHWMVHEDATIYVK
tara:strand:- start:374 stop:649 length:276 start_codon:yes stop_codon:yes gene_type:complete